MGRLLRTQPDHRLTLLSRRPPFHRHLRRFRRIRRFGLQKLPSRRHRRRKLARQLLLHQSIRRRPIHHRLRIRQRPLPLARTRRTTQRGGMGGSRQSPTKNLLRNQIVRTCPQRLRKRNTLGVALSRALRSIRATFALFRPRGSIRALGRPISPAGLNTGSRSPYFAHGAQYGLCRRAPQHGALPPSPDLSHLPQADVYSPSPDLSHLPQADVYSPSPFMERGGRQTGGEVKKTLKRCPISETQNIFIPLRKSPDRVI